jgi:4-carboxymuconolactone decarboxylase
LAHVHDLLTVVPNDPSERRTMAGSTSETPVLDLLASMTADSLEASSLDSETLMLVRIAALAAIDAPSVSYLLNLGAANEVGIDAEQVRGVLAAIAPIVGTARVASATGKIVDALEVAIEIAEIEDEEQENA